MLMKDPNYKNGFKSINVTQEKTNAKHKMFFTKLRILSQIFLCVKLAKLSKEN
jgi:hypothetical protein